jgi:hypothetical protein
MRRISERPLGRHPLQLYSPGTPRGAEYDAWLIRIDEGKPFGSGS